MKKAAIVAIGAIALLFLSGCGSASSVDGAKPATMKKCGSGKCGEGKCGGSVKKMKPKCGEGKCGGSR